VSYPLSDAPVAGHWQVTATILSGDCDLLAGVSRFAGPLTPLGDFLEIRTRGTGLEIFNAIYCGNFCPWGNGTTDGDTVTLSSRRTAPFDGACTLEVAETDTGTIEGNAISGEFSVTASPGAGCEPAAPCTLRGRFIADRCDRACGPLLDCFRICPS
jgi:hypothetical protein